MDKRVVFKHKFLPYILVTPQIIITIVFFIWPASQALYQSFLREDPFGLSSKFVGLTNFVYIFTDDIYLNSLYTTVIFSFSVAAIAMSTALLLGQTVAVVHSDCHSNGPCAVCMLAVSSSCVPETVTLILPVHTLELRAVLLPLSQPSPRSVFTMPTRGPPLNLL